MLPKIEHWALAYDSPQKTQIHLHGLVYDHPEHKDGTPITTSRIIGMDPVINSILTKSGHKYLLGEVDPEYEAMYPNAKERIRKALLS